MRLDDISVAIGRLESKVDGINTRLDRMNNTISKHETRILACEAQENEEKGAIKVWTLVFSLFFSIAALVISILNFLKR